MRLPRMVWAGIFVLALDVAALAAMMMTPGTGLGPVLFQLGTFVGAWGGMEALNWVATGSPWRVAGWIEGPGGNLAERMGRIPWADPSWLRSAVLRLLSGAVVAFGACLLPVLYWSPGEWAMLPYLLLLLQLVRLGAVGVSAMLTAPLLLLAGDQRPTRADRFHALLAGSLSLFFVCVIYLCSGCPPLAPFLTSLLTVALNPADHAYGLMVGGLAWWMVCRIGRWMGRE